LNSLIESQPKASAGGEGWHVDAGEWSPAPASWGVVFCISGSLAASRMRHGRSRRCRIATRICWLRSCALIPDAWRGVVVL